jgi:hypothetical protein
VKQLLRHWTAGGLVDSCRELRMRESDPEALVAWLRGASKKKLASVPLAARGS